MDVDEINTPVQPNKKARTQKIASFSLKDRLGEVYAMEAQVSVDFLNFVLDVSQNVTGKTLSNIETSCGDSSSPNKILERLGRMKGGDFSTSQIISLYKRRPGVFLKLLTAGSPGSKLDVSFEPILTFMSELHAVSKTIGCSDAFMGYIGKLTESNLLGVRFTATSFVILILHTYASVSKRTITVLLSMLTSRMQDVNETVRRLVTTDCMLRSLISQPQQVWVDKNVLFSNALNDPSKSNRIYVLKYLNELIRSGNQRSLLNAGSEIGKYICDLCFDNDEVSRLAIRLLSDINIGEFLIGNDVVMFQQIANQIWNIVSNPSDPLLIARESFIFVNSHILASPGLIGGCDDEEQQLEILLEFVDQYSDGWVFELNKKLVLSIFDHDEKNFLANIDMLLTAVSSMIRQKDHVQAKKRLNTALEILLSVLTIKDDECRTILSETPLAKLLVEILGDENDEEFHSVSDIVDINDVGKLRGRRCIIEIIIDIVNVVFQQPGDETPVSMFPSIDCITIKTENKDRKKAVVMVRNFLKEFCI